MGGVNQLATGGDERAELRFDDFRHRAKQPTFPTWRQANTFRRAIRTIGSGSFSEIGRELADQLVNGGLRPLRFNARYRRRGEKHDEHAASGPRKRLEPQSAEPACGSRPLNQGYGQQARRLPSNSTPNGWRADRPRWMRAMSSTRTTRRNCRPTIPSGWPKT